MDISRWWNHRTRVQSLPQPRRGDRQNLVCRPSGAGRVFGYCFRWFHHRLISDAPPAQKLVNKPGACAFSVEAIVNKLIATMWRPS
jgi:hypothetical protein